MNALGPIAVVAFLVSCMAVFGGVIGALGSACNAIAPDCLTWPGATVVIGLVALAATLAYARFVVISVGSRKRRQG